MRIPVVVPVAVVAALLAGQAFASTERDKVKSEIDALIAQRKYLSAARLIAVREELRAEPVFLRKLTHILVTDYAHTFNFRMFALRDLGEGEDLESIRGKEGSYELVGGDLERLLHEALAARPDDPDLHFAVGEWLSRGRECGCGTPELFTGADADEVPHFERALAAGISDDWSLFRLAVAELSRADPDPAQLAKARSLLERSLAVNPGFVPARYNAAVAAFLAGDLAPAREQALLAVGRYRDPGQDADTYNLLGRIEMALGSSAEAEKAFRKALERTPHHASAFTGLLELLRAGGRKEDYRRRVTSFVELDLDNTYPIGVWVEFVARTGVTDDDRAVAAELAARRWDRPEEVGAVFFGLGHIAQIDGDRAVAHQRFERSLAALKKLKKAPAGSIEALSELVRRTRPDRSP